MTELSTLIILVFIVTIIASSKFFYLRELGAYTKRMIEPLELDILQLNYSFEQMVYLKSISNHSINKENLNIQIDYNSIFFPQIIGIKIMMMVGSRNEMIAYLPIKDFRLPILDQLLEQGKIDEKCYYKISTYKLIHEETKKEILAEVGNKLEKEVGT